MIEELLISDAWSKKENEPIEVYSARIDVQKTELRNYIRSHGQCYLIKFGDEDIRPIWEDKIDSEKLRQIIPSPLSMPLDCPLCQPYDNFDALSRTYHERRYMTKIVNPRYPQGFIDKEGVWVKCPCILKGEKRKWLKFIGMK